jgi:hypothetical protein
MFCGSFNFPPYRILSSWKLVLQLLAQALHDTTIASQQLTGLPFSAKIPQKIKFVLCYKQISIGYKNGGGDRVSVFPDRLNFRLTMGIGCVSWNEQKCKTAITAA